MLFKNFSQLVTRLEKRFIWLIILGLVVLTSVPYLYGWLTVGEDYTYLGTHSLNPADNFVYYSYIEQVREGHQTFKDLYTSEEQTFGTFNVFWWGTGWLAKIFRLSAPVAFHLLRLILIIPFCFLLYCFLSLFISGEAQRKFALALVVSTGSLGPFIVKFLSPVIGLAGQIYYYPVDVWLADVNTFLAILQSPHLLAALTLLLGIFLCFLEAAKKNDLRYSLAGGLLALLLANFHPQQTITIGAVLLLGIIFDFILSKRVNWSYLKHYLVVVVLIIPSLYYHYWLLNNEIIIKTVWLQNITLTPPLIFVLIDLGLILLLALAGLVIKLKKAEPSLPASLVLAWALAGLPLLYLPLHFQSRLALGWQIPLLVLASTFLFSLGERLLFWTKNKIKYLLIGLVIVLLGLPNLFIVAKDIVYLQNKDFSQFYLNRGLEEILAWVEENTDQSAIIMAHPDESRLIPGLAGRTVYLGHPIETLWPKQKEQEVKDFFYSYGPAELKKEFLQRKNISYVLIDGQDQDLDDFKKIAQKIFKPVYNQGDYIIYSLK